MFRERCSRITCQLTQLVEHWAVRALSAVAVVYDLRSQFRSGPGIICKSKSTVRLVVAFSVRMARQGEDYVPNLVYGRDDSLA